MNKAKITSKYVDLNDSYTKLPFFSVADLKNCLLKMELAENCIDRRVLRLTYLNIGHPVGRFQIIDLVEGDECLFNSNEAYLGCVEIDHEVHFFFVLKEESTDSIDLSKKRLYEMKLQEGLMANGK